MGDSWLSTLNLRFSQKEKSWGQPNSVLPLVYPNPTINFNGPSYNENRTISFQVPVWASKRVAVAAIITGHSGCEFEPTSHHFVVNGRDFNTSAPEFRDRYMEAGSPLGCAEKTNRGAVPNEHGTWYYGRNGWCDGEDVKPMLFDITTTLGSDPEKGTHDLRYYAFSYGPNGVEPNQNGCAGNIQMSSYLLFW